MLFGHLALVYGMTTGNQILIAMSMSFLNAQQYYVLKTIYGEIYQRIKNDEPVEDSLHASGIHAQI